MNKEKKLKKINEIGKRFINARNHGGGGNWWYPKRNVIAYDIKMSSFGFSYDDIKDKISDKQKDFYKNINGMIDSFYWDTLNNELEYFIEDLKEEYECIKECYQAGRSGGWLEIEYINELGELWDRVEDFESSEVYSIDYIYNEMIKLDKKEREISSKIKKALNALNKYIDSEDFINDFINTLMTDADISNYYKQEAKRLINKI